MRIEIKNITPELVSIDKVETGNLVRLEENGLVCLKTGTLLALNGCQLIPTLRVGSSTKKAFPAYLNANTLCIDLGPALVTLDSET